MAKETTDVEKCKDMLATIFANKSTHFEAKPILAKLYQRLEKLQENNINPSKKAINNALLEDKKILELDVRLLLPFITEGYLQLESLQPDKNLYNLMKEANIPADLQKEFRIYGNDQPHGNTKKYEYREISEADLKSSQLFHKTITILQQKIGNIQDNPILKLFNFAAINEEYELMGVMYQYSYEVLHHMVNVAIDNGLKTQTLLAERELLQNIIENSVTVLQALAPEEYEKRQKNIQDSENDLELQTLFKNNPNLSLEKFNEQRKSVAKFSNQAKTLDPTPAAQQPEKSNWKPATYSTNSNNKANASSVTSSTNNTISQIKSDERFKSETEGVYKQVHDRGRAQQKNEVSFESGNWYNTELQKFTDGSCKVIRDTENQPLINKLNEALDKALKKGKMSYEIFGTVFGVKMLRNLAEAAFSSEQYELLGLVYKYSKEILENVIDEKVKSNFTSAKQKVSEVNEINERYKKNPQDKTVEEEREKLQLQLQKSRLVLNESKKEQSDLTKTIGYAGEMLQAFAPAEYEKYTKKSEPSSNIKQPETKDNKARENAKEPKSK